MTRQAPPGFSLIELLVVIAMMSVLSIGATLTLARRGDGPRTETFLQDARKLRRLAMVTGTDHALAVGPPGWQAERADADGSWQALAGHRGPGPILALDGSGQKIERLVLRATGAVDPVRLQFGSQSRIRFCETRNGALPTCPAN